MEIKVGDIVRVTNWGRGYTTNAAWFEEYSVCLDFKWVVKYSYGNENNYIHYQFDDNRKYKVLFIADDRALITLNIGGCDPEDYGATYLIGTDAIELYDSPVEMTVAEIEEKLGIKNLKIIKEK